MKVNAVRMRLISRLLAIVMHMVPVMHMDNAGSLRPIHIDWFGCLWRVNQECNST